MIMEMEIALALFGLYAGIKVWRKSRVDAVICLILSTGLLITSILVEVACLIK